MIKDLQELGKWLNDNDQDDFGKNVKDDDYIFTILFENKNFSLESIVQKNDCNLPYFEESCFNNDFFHSTDQTVIIPSKSNLLGFSPFFIKLDHNFLKNNELNEVSINKFKNKIERSLKANKNNKEFVNIINNYFNKSFLDNCPFNENQRNSMDLVLSGNSKEDVVDLILKYYTFLFNNYKCIIDSVIDFKESDNYINKKGNFYLACVFGDSKDLLNDFFYNFSKFLKSRNNEYDDDVEGICSICHNKITTYPPLPYYAIIPHFAFNSVKDVKNSRLKLCKNCSSFIRYADDKLNNIINMNSILIIPKSRGNSDFTEFLKIANQDTGSFKKLNKFLRECHDFNFDLLIISDDKKSNKRVIKKYIENYKAFLVKFENLQLYNNNGANYLFYEIINNKNDENKYLNNTFAFENIFKEFFYEIEENKWKFPKLYNFYEIYTKELTGSGGIFNNFTSQTVNIFSKYAENIFDFIYNVNLDALNKNMINEIVLNSLVKIQKNSFGKKNFKFDMLKRLNYYFMFKKEFLGDNMLKSENVTELKRIFGKENSKDTIVLSNDDESNIEKLINEDPALKYYLLGQFIAYIDIMKGKNDKNSNVFSNFIDNVTRNNIKKIFVTEILQKNNFYINKLGKKGKFVFTILEINIDILFDESNDFDYEDYILLLFTGYYAQNILINNYKFEEE